MTFALIVSTKQVTLWFNLTTTLTGRYSGPLLRKPGKKPKKSKAGAKGFDASIVKIPIQRNTRDENKQIKNGDQPKEWSESNRETRRDPELNIFLAFRLNVPEV